jgi:hypothetical protein
LPCDAPVATARETIFTCVLDTPPGANAGDASDVPVQEALLFI